MWLIPDQSNPSNPAKQLLKFFKLRTIPDQFYCNVSEVRTSDDAVLTVKLMLFYHLKDIHKMLHTTHDPAAESINMLLLILLILHLAELLKSLKETVSS